MSVETLQEKKQSLSTSLRYLKGVGPERYKILQRLGVSTLEEMMHLYPRRYEDRKCPVPTDCLVDGSKQLVLGVVLRKKLLYARGGKAVFRLSIKDESGILQAIWFQCPFLDKTFQEGQRVALFGKVERVSKAPQMIHPDYEVFTERDGRRIHSGRIVPMYPLTQDLHQRGIRALQYELLLRYLRDIKDPIPSSIRVRQKLVNKLFAIKEIHFPQGTNEMDQAVKRLTFEEFFLIQVMLAVKRSAIKKGTPSVSTKAASSPGLDEEFKQLIPFKLTKGQLKAIEDIKKDLGHESPMNRLLQGDVGSGKTIVAAFALFAVLRSGFQGAMMAPTEILAQQHYFTLSKLFSAAGIAVGLLTQGQSEDERSRILSELAQGELKIVVGTHALIQEAVKFSNLRLTVVDEQHKFGVYQRKFMQDKSSTLNHLIMSATPIPRTLAMTLYGELDMSVMSDMPKGRGSIETVWVGENQRESVYSIVDQELSKGRQAYIVFPSIDQSNALNLKDATTGLGDIRQRFPNRTCELIHGKVPAEQKKVIMRNFKKNAIQILVATTVIEVGIDVANATCLVVENADRFGLSQLHQLRGRVGRGSLDSTCILVSDSENPIAVSRLRSFACLDSGFDIAEEDLKLRGPGDFFGSRQHGIPELRIGDLVRDTKILEAARNEAFELVREDHNLNKNEHRELKRLLKTRFKRS